jgi:hypothetical protein
MLGSIIYLVVSMVHKKCVLSMKKIFGRKSVSKIIVLFFYFSLT